jgi:diguanylate cyclase (GGDEF)-like protein
MFTGLLREIGKLSISERVLLKPGRLSPDERRLVELHPVIGARIVERVPLLAGLAPGIRHHHERWDGRGYPDGLGGDDIPVDARVIAVADCFSALVSKRPYRQQLTPSEACEEIERCAGSQFDPTIAELFVEEVRRRPVEPAETKFAAGRLPASTLAAEGAVTAPLGAASATATDGVTLLYSHRHLQEVAAREAQRAARSLQPFAVAMVELSELSMINRREGYAAGDGALQLAARALERAVAGEPATVGRYSGRRLAAILPGAGYRAASEHESELLDQLARSGPRVSVGIAVWQDGDHGEDVLARACLAVHAAPAVG